MRSCVPTESPLDAFRLFQTKDMDQAREIVGRHFCSHRLDQASQASSFDACHNRAEGRHISLNYIRYGADVEIEPGELTEFYLIQIPITGAARIRNGLTEVDSDAFCGTVLNPDLHTTMRWLAGCEQILLQVDRSFMHEVAAALTRVPIDAELRFSPKLDLTRPATAGWRNALFQTVLSASSGDGFGGLDDLRQRHLEETLVAGLLDCQPNTLSPLLDAAPHGAVPAVLRRAISLIRERFSEPLTLLDIAQSAAISPRSLQLAFKRELGCTPMQYLQGVRLDYARHLLLSCDGSGSVSEAAELSGHPHLGRFSVAYRKRYGETPRQTLQSKRMC